MGTIKSGIAAVSGFAACAAFSYWQNNGMQTTHFNIKNEKLPNAFDGYRITQVSDLHDKWFGKAQNRLIRAVAATNPNLIVITGDLCDCQLDAAMAFIHGVTQLAPVCFVPGNHEARSMVYGQLCEELDQAGVVQLNNKRLFIHNNIDKICIAGMKDPAFYRKRTLKRDTPECVAVFSQYLGDLAQRRPNSDFTVLLSHRPEHFPLYVQNGFDLIFCGHAHGGQFRFPGVPGLYAPEQGILPQYTAGLYQRDGCTMVVSRGLGGSTFPQRIGNRPELVCVTLKKY